MNFDLDRALVLKTLVGSRAHGTALPGADEDLRGVLILPRVEYYLGLNQYEQYERLDREHGIDVCYYEIRKFARLAMSGNPSVYAIFAGPKQVAVEPYASEIMALWPLVISKRIVASHIGMATAHMKGMNHRGRNTGEKGREAIERHGYNTKDAGHVIRVLGQCADLLRTGTFVFPRPNAAELLEIKTGQWTEERVRARAEQLIAELRGLEASSSLPDEPDFDAVSTRVAGIVEGYFKAQRNSDSWGALSA